jgi:hypothetical protein
MKLPPTPERGFLVLLIVLGLIDRWMLAHWHHFLGRDEPWLAAVKPTIGASWLAGLGSSYLYCRNLPKSGGG